jgi:LysR family hydrogen peroxide-inducible transcriptional activator
MTLTELRYIVAVAREHHFGRAAESCFVSQPTLSVAIKKLEDELGVTLFERGSNEVTVTPVGVSIVAQAARVLEQTGAIKELASQGKNPLKGVFRLGVIYTIGPYLLPEFMKQMVASVPHMPLLLQENFTVRLLEMVKLGEIDAAIMALPLPESGLAAFPLYDEPFLVAVPRDHAWAKRRSIGADELNKQTMLLLGSGHCFRDQVLEVCPELSRFSPNPGGIQKTFEGSSLETIRHMVASGVGITVMPQTSVPTGSSRDSLLRYIPFEKPAPNRRVVLVWRKTYPRRAAIDAVRRAVDGCELNGVKKLSLGQIGV